MGTSICAFTNHNLPVKTGRALLEELRQRLQAPIYLVASDDDPRATGHEWELVLYHYKKKWVTDPDVFWPLNQAFELYRKQEDGLTEGLLIHPQLLEIDCPYQTDWTWFCRDLTTNNKEAWLKYRQQVQLRARQLGGGNVIYLSDMVCEALLFIDDDSKDGTYARFDQMMQAGLQEGFPLWDVSHQVSLNGVSPGSGGYDCMLLDDFSDIKEGL